LTELAFCSWCDGRTCCERGKVLTAGGFIAGSLQPTVINPAPIAMEHGRWASDGSGLRLLRAFEKWARSEGATLIQMSTGVDGIDLTRLGYRRVELAWVKRMAIFSALAATAWWSTTVAGTIGATAAGTIIAVGQSAAWSLVGQALQRRQVDGQTVKATISQTDQSRIRAYGAQPAGRGPRLL
jgi:hypothetical protein